MMTTYSVRYTLYYNVLFHNIIHITNVVHTLVVLDAEFLNTILEYIHDQRNVLLLFRRRDAYVTSQLIDNNNKSMSTRQRTHCSLCRRSKVIQ